MGCNCNDDKKKETLIMSDENSLDVILASPNIGQRYIHGARTKVRYGYFGGGDLIPAMHKEDIIARASWFRCGNCRGALTVSGNDVYCASCRRPTRVAIQQEQLSEAVSTIRSAPPPSPPPTPIVNLPGYSPLISMPPSQLVTEKPASKLLVPIENIDFGRSITKPRKKILKEAGIITLQDAVDKGKPGLVEIKGIGGGIAEALLTEAAKR